MPGEPRRPCPPGQRAVRPPGARDSRGVPSVAHLSHLSPRDKGHSTRDKGPCLRALRQGQRPPPTWTQPRACRLVAGPDVGLSPAGPHPAPRGPSRVAFPACGYVTPPASRTGSPGDPGLRWSRCGSAKVLDAKRYQACPRPAPLPPARWCGHGTSRETRTSLTVTVVSARVASCHHRGMPCTCGQT